MSNLLLIDGDILVYRFGFAAEGKDGTVKTPKYVFADISNFLADLLTDYVPDSTDYEGFLSFSTESNFRHYYAVTAPYKGNRQNKKPVLYNEIRDYLVNSWGFKMVLNQEADDTIAIAATENPDSVICSIDKDLDQVPGKHFNFVKKEHYSIEYFEGLRNFYTQCLTGDRIDNIIGVRGIGPVKAKRMLQDCATEEALFDAVVQGFGGDRVRAIENGRLAWLRRYPDQIWEPPK